MFLAAKAAGEVWCEGGSCGSRPSRENLEKVGVEEDGFRAWVAFQKSKSIGAKLFVSLSLRLSGAGACA